MISKLVRWVCALHKYHAGNNSNISKSRRPIRLLFSVYSRKLRLFNNYLSWFISHLFQKENGSWKFRVCSSVFIKVTLECNSFGVCHHWHLIHADLLGCWARWHLHGWIHIHGQKCQGGTCSYCISENELGALCLWNICFEWYYSSCDDLIAYEALQNSIVQKGLWGVW